VIDHVGQQLGDHSAPEKPEGGSGVGRSKPIILGWERLSVFSQRILFLALWLASCGGVFGQGPTSNDDPTLHSFPALGSFSNRLVAVEWNRFYDTEGLHAILARLHEAFPRLTKLYSLGQSVEGRDLWCLEITNPDQGNTRRKPGMLLVANIHGNEIQGGEAIAYTAHYLCHQAGRLPAVNDLLDHSIFYLVPTINPDGRDHWLHGPHTMSSSRSGVKPVDDDHDGLFDEDDVDDLDGDGSITQMRIRDPKGRWKPHPDFPEYLMIPAKDDEAGEYEYLGLEGLDNDGDGRVNEDPVGGYDMNRNWAWDWQPPYVQGGAHEYPFSLPETRAVSAFALAHTNLVTFISMHNFGGMILRPPGREGGNMRPGDDRLLTLIAGRGEKIMPYYRSLLTWKDLYPVWGGEIDWFYSGRGVLSFVSEIWNLGSLAKAGPLGLGGSRDDEATFLKHVLLGDGVVKWHEFDHPTYGKIEIGGTKKEWGRTPVSFLIEEECHRNMAFSLHFASHMPRLSLDAVEVDRLDAGLYRVWVTIHNSRLIPTRIDQDVRNHISPPDVVTLAGPDVKVISSGRVTDRFFKRVDAVKRRPERVELDAIPGLGVERVQFVVKGSGAFTVTVDSAKAGVVTAEKMLP
jgi:hypothetical protein